MYKPRSPSASPHVAIRAMICMCLCGATLAAPPASVRIYVDLSATGNHTGTAWIDAYTDLHDALAEAATIASPTTPVEIWVAEGLYQPDHGTGDRLDVYQVPAYTELYGGFAGTEAVRSQRDWHANPTILDGDLLGNDDLTFVPTSDCCSEHTGSGCDDAACTAKVAALDMRCIDPLRNAWFLQCVDYAIQQCCDICRPSRCDNAFRILEVPNGDGVVVDGFSIRSGEASYYQIQSPYASGPTYGAGMHVDQGNIVLRNNAFAAHSASGSSAAILLNGGSVVEFCTFSQNHGFASAGGTLGIGPDLDYSVVRDCLFTTNRTRSLTISESTEVRRCVFVKNQSAIDANGTSLIADSVFIANEGNGLNTVLASGFSASVVNCLFFNNTNLAGAGTLVVHYGGRIVDCAFIGNSTTGGAIVVTGGLFGGSSVINSLFVGNRVKSGGALTGTPLTIYNSVFWHNRDDDPNTSTQHEQIRPFGGPQTINFSIVEGWDGSLGGVGNSGVDPLFVDPLGPDMLPNTGDENYRLSFDSPAINAGHPNPPLLAVRDLDGHRRTLCGATDLGPYEFGIADPDCDGDTDLADYFALPACLTGPTPIALPVSCHPFDFDADDAVDLSDVAGFANSFSGP